MKDYTMEHRAIYEQEWNKAVNRFEREFLNEFATEDGGINWEKLTQFNSGKDKTQTEKNH